AGGGGRLGGRRRYRNHCIRFGPRGTGAASFRCGGPPAAPPGAAGHVHLDLAPAGSQAGQPTAQARRIIGPPWGPTALRTAVAASTSVAAATTVSATRPAA